MYAWILSFEGISSKLFIKIFKIISGFEPFIFEIIFELVCGFPGEGFIVPHINCFPLLFASVP